MKNTTNSYTQKYKLNSIYLYHTPDGGYVSSEMTEGYWKISMNDIVNRDGIIIYSRHSNMSKNTLTYIVEAHNVEVTLGLPQSSMKDLARKGGYLTPKRPQEKKNQKRKKVPSLFPAAKAC